MSTSRHSCRSTARNVITLREALAVFFGDLDEVSAHAEMVAEIVADRRMPPWYANRRHTFANERGLTTAEQHKLPRGSEPKCPRGMHPNRRHRVSSRIQNGKSATPTSLRRRWKRTICRRKGLWTTVTSSCRTFSAGHLDFRGRDSPFKSGCRSSLQSGVCDDWPELQRRQLHHRPRPRWNRDDAR